VRVHNRKTLELKLEYIPKGQPDSSDYNINMFLFIPESVGINESTYEKRYFYSDLFRSIRLKSPDYFMNHYYNKLKDFDKQCVDGIQETLCEYMFKKFVTGYRSMLRSGIEPLGKTSIQADIDFLIENVRKNRSILRKLCKKFGSQQEMFALGDEFTSIVTNVYLARLHEKLDKHQRGKILNTIKSELKYRQKHYPQSMPGNSDQNARLVARYDYLKGYFFNVLSLRARRKAGDKTVKNILYASAAGLSMVIATLITFWAQQKYGNFTLPFFAALVVGYMFKDRVKDGFKILLEKVAAPTLFDYITLIYESTGTLPMGKTWEKAGFVTPEKLPDYIADADTAKKHILHYSKKVHIENRQIKDVLDPEIHGVTDIMRLNISRFISGLEEPLALMYSVRDGSLEKTYAEKIYEIPLHLRVEASGNVETVQGILSVSANGIKNFRMI
jgi:hypothetical protein